MNDQKELAKTISDFMSNFDEVEIVPENPTEKKDEQESEKHLRKSVDKYAFGEHFEQFERRSTRLSSKALSVNQDDKKTHQNEHKIEVADEEELKEERDKHLEWFYNLKDELNYSIEDLFLVKH